MAARIFRPKSLLLLTSVFSVVLLYALLVERKQRLSMNATESDLRAQLDSSERRLDVYSGLLRFDSVFVGDRNVSKAQRMLDSLYEVHGSANTEAFQIRRAFIDWVSGLNDLNNFVLPSTAQEEKKNKEYLQLSQLVDSLTQANKVIQSNARRDFEALSAELDKLRNDLRKQERVKVISFPGQKGATVHYLGEVANGQANGGGIGIWTTGSVYRGDWRNNLRHGQGNFQWADGEKYIGAYVNGKREGMGVYLWPSGDKYDGEWKNDRRNGQGTLYDLDGRIVFSGLWVDDQPKN